MVWFSRALLSLGLCLGLAFRAPGAAAKPAYAAAPAASGNFGWQRQSIAELSRDSGGETTLFVGKLICAQGYRNVRLRCWDVNSGAVQFNYDVPAPGSGKSVESAGYVLGSGGILLAYHVGTELWLRELELTKGTERRAVQFKFDDDVSAHVGSFRPYGSSILYSLRKKVGKTWSSLFRSVDGQTGKIAYEIPVDFSLGDWDFAADVVYFGSSSSKGTAVLGYDLKTGKKLFARPFGREFLHGIAAGPHEVFVEFDTKLVRLDERTGQPKGSVAVDKQGNKGPRVLGDRVYVCASGLAAFSLTLTPIAHIALPNEWIIDCELRDGYATFHDNHIFHLADLRSHTLIATDQIREDKNVRALGSFDGHVLPVLETSDEGADSLTLRKRVPAESLRVVGLPAGAALLEDAEPAAALVTHGKHRFEVFRPGFRPVVVDLDVRGPASAQLDLQKLTYEPAPSVAPPNQDTLPAGLEITALAQARSSEHNLSYGSFGSFADGGRRVAFDGSQGLFARSMRTARDDWNVPTAQIHADAGVKDFGRLGGMKLYAVLPNARLALLGSHGLVKAVLLGYDLDTGKLRWRASSDLRSPPSAQEYYFDAVTEHSGLFWYHTSTGLYGRDLRDGHLVYHFQYAYGEGLWGAPIFQGERAFALFRKQLLGLDLASRKIVFRTPISGRGSLTLGPNAQSLLFVDLNEVRLFSLSGAAQARSPKLGGDLVHAPAPIKPEAIYVCAGVKNTFHALDPKSLKPRWSFTNRTGESPCPKIFSAQQVAATDSHKSIVFDRKTGKVLLEQADLLPDSRHLQADASGVCLLQRKGSVCFDR